MDIHTISEPHHLSKITCAENIKKISIGDSDLSSRGLRFKVYAQTAKECRQNFHKLGDNGSQSSMFTHMTTLQIP